MNGKDKINLTFAHASIASIVNCKYCTKSIYRGHLVAVFQVCMSKLLSVNIINPEFQD